MDKIRIIIIEDHDLTRIGLVTALRHVEDLEVVGEAATGLQGLKLLDSAKPDVAILDIGLPDIDGVEVAGRYKQTHASDDPATAKILMLTMHKSQDSVLAAFAAGADSYCMKDINVDKLTEAIRSTQKGNPWIDPAIANIVLYYVRQLTPAMETVTEVETVGGSGAKVTIQASEPEYQRILENTPLTARELEILDLIVAGCNNADIADKLYITIGTVKTHVRNILNKLCVDDRTQAAVRALRSGLVG
ncbi:MAG: response regulator transcription factor [Snowella sp.]|nr:response regulator transcription factor [Snowella sp.]